MLPDYGCKIEIDVVQLLKENEFLKDELYNRAFKDIKRQEIEIEALKDKCVDLVAEKILEALRRWEEELDKEDSNQD